MNTTRVQYLKFGTHLNHLNRSLHCKSYKLGFVEVLRQISRFEGIQSAERDEEEIPEEGNEEGSRFCVALEDHSSGQKCRDKRCIGPLLHYASGHNHALYSDKNPSYYNLQ